jgi:hypothetical protein
VLVLSTVEFLLTTGRAGRAIGWEGSRLTEQSRFDGCGAARMLHELANPANRGVRRTILVAMHSIRRVELSCTASIHCPFCGTGIVAAAETGVVSIVPCPHTLFVATDEGFEYRSERFNQLKGIVGVDDEDIDTGDENYDGYTDDLDVSNSVKFAVYVPAPSGFGTYFGFACQEGD